MAIHSLAVAAMALTASTWSANEARTTMLPPEQTAPTWTMVSENAETARWRTPVCVGVGGLSEGTAQFVVDRVSRRARDVGLRVGEAGCRANALIIFSADPDGQANAIASERTDPASSSGVRGATLGRSAFTSFLNSSAPVRWWRVTQPMVETGEAATRDVRLGVAPTVHVQEPGRLGTTTLETVSHAIVIVDLQQVNGLPLGALADYLAMVVLAPVEADQEAHSSILGLFTDRASGRTPAQGMTEADQAHLRDVYP